MHFLFLGCLILVFVGDGQSALVATANIHIDSTSVGVGTILFHQDTPHQPVRVVGIIDGLKANTVHGFHVHRDPLPMGVTNCSAAGPHFNPDETLHGPPEADVKNRHIGDLGNVTANENGIIIVQINDPLLELFNNTRSIAGRTIVLHAIRDDGGKGGFPDSNTTGNAGPRIACGVISLSQQESSATSNPLKIKTTIHDFMEQLFP